MKKLVLLSFLSVLICFSKAQQAEQKFSVQLQAGPSIPLGRFADKAFSTSKATGNAMIGGAVNIQLQYQLTKNWGGSLLIGGSINRQDEEYIEKKIKNGREGVAASVDAKSWKVFKIMPGIFYDIPLSSGSKFSFKPMLSAGVCKTAIPAFSYATATTNPVTASSGKMAKEKLPLTFCYQLSLGANYNLSKKVYLLFDVAYFNASLASKNSYIPYAGLPTSPVFGDTPTIPSYSGKTHYSLASLNMLAGAGIRF